MYSLNWDKGVWGACHASDIPFVFGGVTKTFGKMLTGGSPEAEALHRKIRDAWLAFAKTGSPKTETLNQWQSYSEEKRLTQILDESCIVVEDPLEEQRTFWDDVC